MVNKNKLVDKLHDRKESSLSLFSIDDYLDSDPAAGYRNGSSLNNVGSKGNYWSSRISLPRLPFQQVRYSCPMRKR